MKEDEPVRVQVPGEVSSQLLSAVGGVAADRRGQYAWVGFEWARNPYVILITIYIFAPYFSSQVVGDPVRGQAIWGNINGIGGAIIALLGPVLGATETAGRTTACTNVSDHPDSPRHTGRPALLSDGSAVLLWWL